MIPEREPESGEYGGPGQNHPEDAQGVGAQQVNRGGCRGDMVSKKSVIPAGDGIDDGEEQDIAQGKEGTVQKITEGGPKTLAAKNARKGKDDEAVVDPEDPESQVRRVRSDGGRNEGPDVQSEPEIHYSPEEINSAEEGERAEHIGHVAEVKRQAAVEGKACRHQPVACIDDPGGEASPSHEEAEKALPGFFCQVVPRHPHQ